MRYRIALQVLLVALVCTAGVLWAWTAFRAPHGQYEDYEDSEDRPPRIVALSPAIAVTLRDLGLSHLIVGRHAWDMVLGDDVPVCGDQTGIDYEALIAARPTHVLTQWGTRDLPARLEELRRQRGWFVHDHRLLSLNDVADTAVVLAEQFGAWASDDAALPSSPANVREALDQAWLHRDGVAAAGRILLLASVDPPAALGPGSCHHELLVRLGGRPAMEAGRPYVPLEIETLLSMDADVIVVFRARASASPDTQEWAEIEQALGPLAQRPIPAVTSRRVVIIEHPLALTPATSLMEVARLLGEGIEALDGR